MSPDSCVLSACFNMPCLDCIGGLNDGCFVGLSQNLKILLVTSLVPTLIFHQSTQIVENT